MSRAQGLPDWRDLPRWLMAWPIRGYRFFLSPWLGSACRFEPTCSRYGLQALERHGALAGTYLTLARLARCHPLCEGGHDPVPAQRPRLFSHLLPAATKSDFSGHSASVGTDSETSLPRPMP